MGGGQSEMEEERKKIFFFLVRYPGIVYTRVTVGFPVWL